MADHVVVAGEQFGLSAKDVIRLCAEKANAADLGWRSSGAVSRRTQRLRATAGIVAATSRPADCHDNACFRAHRGGDPYSAVALACHSRRNRATISALSMNVTSSTLRRSADVLKVSLWIGVEEGLFGTFGAGDLVLGERIDERG